MGWSYLAETIFNMLVGLVKGADAWESKRFLLRQPPLFILQVQFSLQGACTSRSILT